MASTVVGYNVAAIQKMFRNYVESTECKPRHTPEADHEVSLYKEFVAGAIPVNVTLRDDLYDRMMNCAVEFEESGFIAGFRAGAEYALKFFGDPETPIRLETISTPSETAAAPAEAAQDTRQPSTEEVPAESKDASSTPDSDSTTASAEQHDAEQSSTGREGETMTAISSKQIAEFFETTNSKVVKRIEDAILPHLDAERKASFRLEVAYTPQHRRYRLYYLSKVACDIYLTEMDAYKHFVSVAGGMTKMRELMKRVFPVEAAAS